MAERLHRIIVDRAHQRTPQLDSGIEYSDHSEAILFGLESNGIFHSPGSGWNYDYQAVEPLQNVFKAQKVSFYGPGDSGSFFNIQHPNYTLFREAFSQSAVTKVIEKYKDTDEDLATRLSFLMGGIVRHLQTNNQEVQVLPAITYVAEMILLGDHRSAEAIASAMGMYIMSGGSIEKDEGFEEKVMTMAEAISGDPIHPQNTRDLGLSQVARLRAYAKGLDSAFPDITEQRHAFDEFPTVGAEFHLPLKVAQQSDTLWKRLALLNMSQYQSGSSIQLSRNDRGVTEVRMNPSDFPTAAATWKYIKKHLLPELDMPEQNTAFFWLTINRPDKNFSWTTDRALLEKLRALGMLSFANAHDEIPKQRQTEEINFGEIYLGQTVKLSEGAYTYDGHWDGTEAQNGQLSIYAGFGEDFPHLTYWLSMALASPDVLPSYIESAASETDDTQKIPLENVRSLYDAAKLTRGELRRFGMRFSNGINRDERLRKAHEAGQQILQLLA